MSVVPAALRDRLARARHRAVLDALLPEWRVLVGHPARFVDAWQSVTGQCERSGWRWLARAKELRP